MSFHNRMLNKLHQVVAAPDKTRVLDGDCTVTHVNRLKKRIVGKTIKYGKVELIKNDVWVALQLKN